MSETGAGNVSIDARSPALLDADPEIVVRTSPPADRVSLLASTEDATGRWTSRATFEPDEDGIVDVSDSAPVDGDYTGVDGAGILWSMSPANGEGQFAIDGDGYDVRLEARSANGGSTSTTLQRRTVAPDVAIRPVDADGLVGTVAVPSLEEPRPGVLLLHGSEAEPLEQRAKLLASRGFPALALQYFGDPDSLPDDLHEIPRSYFDRAADWFRDRAAVSDGALGVFGQSKGGEGALFLAGHADWVGAVVAVVPSGVAFQGLTRDWTPAPGSSWSVDGEQAPHVPFTDAPPDVTEDGLIRIAATYEAAVERADPERIREATFPIEHCDGPLLCVSSGEDGMWPSDRLTEVAVERMKERGRGEQIEHARHDDAGHAIPLPSWPTHGLTGGDGVFLGGTPQGLAAAGADSWSRTLATFERGLP